MESATKQLIERLHKKLGRLLNDLRQDLFEYKGVVEKTSDFTTLDKSQDITASCLPQLVTGLNQLNCYNAAKISWELHEVGNSYPLQFIRNNHQGLLLQLGNLEYMSMNARSKLAYLYESLQTDNIPQISILWPQDEVGEVMKIQMFSYQC